MFTFKKTGASLAVLTAALFAQAGHAADGLIDSASFEFGTNPEQKMARVSVTSDWDKRWFASNGRHLGGYWDANLAFWRLEAYRNVPGQKKNIGVIGLTPVFRYQADDKLGWYAEAGIGVSLFSKLYKNEDKELSTAFQFADHVGVGYTTAKWDFGLKFQHYSNGSIKSPNAGANWLIAKAAYRF
ncbi:acyloxyacyl hydrolase [Massilia niastensis]|uniref:acyloxyacyl hydrolase n=1 Tax=Massilia niastensis TaxID=544911 RepID=UPI00035CFD2D|nr:acyloxyacyl hydrolase [Massilia niastensis]